MPTHSKYIAPGIRAHAARVPAMSMMEPTDRMSPRVEALRKLVASGQYQVSARHLAHQIMRAAGVKPE
jgi:anti-sigma28 factor (negative regulator of flagellin synthesis)